MLASQLETGAREKLEQRLEDARAQTDKLFDLVRPDSLYERPIPERHRIIFYLGHLEAFDWNLLGPRLLQGTSVNPQFDKLFAFGIDPVGGGLPTDKPADWPSIKEVRRYVAHVREIVDTSFDTSFAKADVHASIGESPEFLWNVAIEHRLMHAETLAYMLHQLPYEQKLRRAQVSIESAERFIPGMIEIPAGSITLGLSRSGKSEFGWDNEYEAHVVEVPAFAIDQSKVTNGEYLRFVEAGGYQNRDFWKSADWEWRTAQNIDHPAFWKLENGRWFWRAMFEEIPLPLDWPVYVSHAEASAYARWAGKRLPTEAEWQRAAYGTNSGIEREFPWGDETPGPEHGYLDFARWDPAPVGAFPEGRSAFGVDGLLANGWEWAATVFEPFSGFERFPSYPGYSADFFDGKHFVMKGGSPRTDSCMLRRSFRNWFQPHYPYVYAGFRCAR